MHEPGVQRGRRAMRLISGMRSLFRGFVAAALILLTPMWVSAGSYQLSLD